MMTSRRCAPSLLQRRRSVGGAPEDHRRPAGPLPGAREEQPDSPLRLAPPPRPIGPVAVDDVTSCRVRRPIRAAAASPCGVDEV